MIQPKSNIEIFGLHVNEPVTTLTDLLISIICFYAFYKLLRIKTKERKQSYLSPYFLSMGIATAVGGLIGHGFLYFFHTKWKFPEEFTGMIIRIVGDNVINTVVSPWKLPGWLTSMISIFLIEMSVIRYSKGIVPLKIVNLFSWLNIIELILFLVLTFSTLDFFFVQVHSTYGLLVVVSGFSLFTFYKTKSEASKLFLVAVGFSSISGLFFTNKWSIHIWFNYLDISHIFMAISAFFFYKGSIHAYQKSPIEKPT